MKNRLISATFALALVLAILPDATHAQLAAPGECYGTTGTFTILPEAQLVRIDPSDGSTFAPLGITGYLAFPAFAIDSQGQLFAAHASNASSGTRDRYLYTIDATTGAATQGPELSGGGGQGISAMAFGPGGVLYAVKTLTDELITIDVTTGAQNFVLSLAPAVGQTRNFAGLAFDPDSELLYASMGGNVSSGLGFENAIYVIDLNLMTVDKVGNLVSTAIAGGVPDLFFDMTGQLFAVKNPLGTSGFPPPPGDLYSVNKTTGVGTFLGDMLHHVTGADCFNPPDGPPPSDAIAVDVDISPAECPNEFNVNKKGRLVVSIQGTADFDVTTIDPGTVTLAGVSPVHAVFEDASRPAGDGECSCTVDGPDGFVDLKLQFEQPDVLAALGGVSNGDVLELPLEGMTVDGDDIEGSDCVTVKVPGNGKFEPGVPAAFELEQNYPNPFNPTTTLTFSVPVESHVDLVIYNSMGQEVSRLVSGTLAEGSHTAVWNATDAFGQSVPSGTYLYRLTAGEFVQTRSMLFLK